MRVKTTANMGAYLSTFASCIPTILYATLLAGQYTTPLIHCEVTAVFTNTAPVDAYRGAGPAGGDLRGRAPGRDRGARDEDRSGRDPAAQLHHASSRTRRRSRCSTTPATTSATLDAALKLADVAGLPRARNESAKNGKLRGLGYACYIEACGIAPSNVAGALGARAGLFEAGEIRVHPTGTVTVFTGSHSHGQGHETTFAQVVADRLGMPIESVDDRARRHLEGPLRHGHLRLALASRSAAPRSSRRWTRSSPRARRSPRTCWRPPKPTSSTTAACSRSPGTDKKKMFGEVAFAAYVPHNYPLDKLEPGLNENAFYDPTNFTFPAGTYVCEVEVDRDTGTTKVDRFTAVDDFGKIINPMIVEGQVHGGLAQGIGQALTEGCRYDAIGPAAHRLVHGLLPSRAPTTCRRSRSTRARRPAPTTRSA